MMIYRRLGVLTVALAMSLASASSAEAQQRGAAAGRAELEVRGTVERVFTSDERREGTRLVELLLESVALVNARAASQPPRMPAPGEVIFIVVERSKDAPAFQRTPVEFPRVGESVRATVRDAGRGVWTASGAPWFETTAAAPAPQDNGAEANSDDARGDKPSLELRGMACTAKIVRGRIALEVTEVHSQGPAHDAGFQVGDVIVGVAGKPMTSLADFRQAVINPQPLRLTVIDVNSGKLADVTLEAAPTESDTGPAVDEAPAPVDADPAVRIGQSLGITVEPASSALRGGVKVATVEPTSPGAAAGLEPGDVIVGVGAKRFTGIKDFAAALPDAGGAITLVVRDVRSGRDVPLEVSAASIRAGDPATEPQTSPDAPPADGASADRLGIATELDFYNEEAAVRVVAVQPGSPAGRAGLRAGWMILKANDAPVMHPDDLAKVEASARGRLTLRVADPATNRQSTITITL